jgi:ATP-dependent RNA helicase DDX54/DBP10
MGFGAQINALLRHMPDPARQTLLFSATMPTQLAEFSRAGLRDPITVR